MKIKTKLFPLLILFFSTNVTAQSIKDYFIPTIDKSSFYTIENNNGTKVKRLIKTINYQKQNEIYIIQTETFYDTGEGGARWSVISNEIIEVTNSEVYLNEISIGNQTEKYESPRTKLKIPLSVENNTWKYKTKNAEIKRTVCWIDIPINGIKRKAIKVLQKCTWSNSVDEEYLKGVVSIEIKYYVKGLGLYKIEYFDSNNKIINNSTELLDNSEEQISLNSNYSKNQESLIAKESKSVPYFEKYISNGNKPPDFDIQIQFNEDMRVIVWNEILTLHFKYSTDALDKLGYEYIKTSENNSQRTKVYRNCSKSIAIEITEWYDLKLSISMQWYSKDVKGRTIYLMTCQ